MKALCWHGKHDVRVEEVPDPQIQNARDAIVKVMLSGICGSDLHLYNGFIPSMKDGDILGHEFVGEVVEVGSRVNNVAPGDRVMVPFPISCGDCWYCKQGLFALCDNSNPNSWMQEKLYGDTGAGIFGYSHIYGGYPGGQAQYVRVPYADVGLHKIPAQLSYEQVLFLTDVFPTGYQAAEACAIKPGDAVAVWGCGPVGLFALKSARHLGAGKVIAIDRLPERLELARKECQAEAVNYEEADVAQVLQTITGGRGPDACIDAVGLEAQGSGLDAAYDTLKHSLRLESDRPTVLRQLIKACRKGGIISVPGVYGGFVDKMPMGAIFAKGLTLHAGQTHVHKYVRPLLQTIERGEIDPTFIITHRMPVKDAPMGYRLFLEKREGCIKVVLTPWAATEAAL